MSRGDKMKTKYLVISVLAFFIFIGIYSTQKNMQRSNPSSITVSEFKEKIQKAPKGTTITETYDGIVTYVSKDKKTFFVTHVNPNKSPIGEYIEDSQVTYKFVKEGGLFGNGFLILLGVFLLFVLLSAANRNRQPQPGQVQKKDSKLVYETPEVSLADVGGLNQETKTELMQIIDLFKNHEKAKSLGIKKPKGALLYGPPGTGKTLIAKAIAKELNAVFFAKSASSFMEMYVGVGSGRVREIFQIARSVATDEKPSLIFIDEIDAIAKKRGGRNSHEERENTLNELLKELDGVESNENVFFIAATNLYDSLDDAFKRSGRISNELYIGLPGEQGRLEILQIHKKDYKLSESTDKELPTVAKSIRGYSGADIEEMYSKAAKHAFNEGKEEIELVDIQHAIDRMVLGTQNQKLLDNDVQKRVAYHEAGHALIQALTFPNSIRKATIIPRGGALGFVAPIPKEIDLATHEELMDRLAMIVAGGVAEREIFGMHSVGVGGDVRQARQLIDAIVEIGVFEKDFELIYETKEIEKAKQHLFKSAVLRSTDYIKTHINILHKIAKALIEKETLDGEEIQQMVKIT